MNVFIGQLARTATTGGVCWRTEVPCIAPARFNEV